MSDAAFREVADVCWMPSRDGDTPPARRGAWPEAALSVGPLELRLAPGTDTWHGLRWATSAGEGWEAWHWGGGAPDPDAVARWLADPTAYEPGDARAVLFVLDRRRDQLHVWTDRFGTHAIHHGPGCVSSSYRTALHASARRLDWEGIATFLGLGFFLDDRTWYTDVRQLAPGTHSVFDSALTCLETTRWARWSYEPDAGRSDVDTLDALDAALAASTKALAHAERIALPLSGGLDSRTLLGILARQDTTASGPWCFGYGYQPQSIETRIAGALAAAREVPFDAYVVPEYLWDAMDDVVAATDGFVDVTQPRQAFMASALSRRCDLVVGGHWGDVWFDDLGLLTTAGDDGRVAEHAFGRLAKEGRS